MFGVSGVAILSALCSSHTSFVFFKLSLFALAWALLFTVLILELVRRDSRSDERERDERSGKKYKSFGRDGEVLETIEDFSSFLEKRYRLSKELASEYISFAFVSSHKVECQKKGVQVYLTPAVGVFLVAVWFDFDNSFPSQALAAIDILHLSANIMFFWYVSLTAVGHMFFLFEIPKFHFFLVT